MKKYKEYYWSFSDEGNFIDCSNTIQGCLAHAKSNILNQFCPEEFIEQMQEHCLTVFICVVKGKELELYGEYILAMSGYWYKAKK